MPEFTIEKLAGNRQDLQIIKLTGPFTLNCVFDFQKLVREDPAPATIVDLTDVPYMDSAALGSLLGLQVSCQRDSRKCVVAGVTPRVATLFRVAGVHEVLTFSPTVQEAEIGLQNSAF